jgi:hypothetical protein
MLGLTVMLGWYSFYLGGKLERSAIQREEVDLVPRWEIETLVELNTREKCAEMYSFTSLE